MTASPATAAPKSASVFEDFVDIFYAPSQVFERRRAGQFGLALLILCVFALVCFIAIKPAIQPAIDAQVDKAIEMMRANPNMPADRVASAEASARKMSDIGGYVSAPFGTAVTVLLSALGLWLVGKVFDSKQTYSQAAMVATYANVPRVVGLILSGLIAFFTPAERMTSMYSISLSPARVLGADASPLALGALSRLDPFVIWATILLAIGLRVTGNVSKRSAYIAAAIVWLIGSMLAIASAARQMG